MSKEDTANFSRLSAGIRSWSKPKLTIVDVKEVTAGKKTGPVDDPAMGS